MKIQFLLKALHRLVEINYHIGLEEEKYAKILGAITIQVNGLTTYLVQIKIINYQK